MEVVKEEEEVDISDLKKAIEHAPVVKRRLSMRRW
jgi:hypothetical protein